MKNLLFASIALAALSASGPALAADILPKAPAYQPPAWTWSGFYFGAHVGAGWAHKEWSDVEQSCFTPPVCRPLNLGSHNAKGVLGGFQVGWNWQFGAVVFGIEAQYSFADLKGDHQDSFSAAFGISGVGSNFNQLDKHDRFFTNIDRVATIAGRFGLVAGPGDRTLFYVKGGAAYAKDDFAATTNESVVNCSVGVPAGCLDVNTNGALAASNTRWGWMVGAGLEFGLFDNWSAKVEYNYLDFGSDTVTLVGTENRVQLGAGLSETNAVRRDVGIDQTMHVVKFGLNYRFSLFGNRY
jgi:outer membrane immunogenic protein